MLNSSFHASSRSSSFCGQPNFSTLLYPVKSARQLLGSTDFLICRIADFQSAWPISPSFRWRALRMRLTPEILSTMKSLQSRRGSGDLYPVFDPLQTSSSRRTTAPHTSQFHLACRFPVSYPTRMDAFFQMTKCQFSRGGHNE